MTQPTREVERPEPNKIDAWRGDLALYREGCRTMLEREARADDAAALADLWRDIAWVASLFDDERQERNRALAASAAYGAAAVLVQARGEGVVLVAGVDTDRRRIPVGSSALTPNPWWRAWSTACIVRDKAALEVLGYPPHLAACQVAPGRADSFWPFFEAALAALSLKDHAADAWIKETQPLLEPGALTVAEPSFVEAIVQPVLRLAKELADGELSGFGDSLIDAARAHAEWYGAPERRNDRSGFLSLPLLALAALAYDAGARFEIDSPYLPQDLIRGAEPLPKMPVLFEYPRRALLRSEEARWFLDLEGFPRDRRRHRVVERGDELIARYELEAGPGLPGANIDLCLPPAPASVPLALDAGDLLSLADRFARQGTEGSLGEAVGCLESVLARIPPGENSVPSASVVSSRGRAVVAAEPGRLGRSRLLALQQAWIAEQAALAVREKAAPVADRSAASESEHDARHVALSQAALITELARPLLIELGRPDAERLAASLQPREDDYPRVFAESRAAQVAAEGYRAWWSEGNLYQRPDAALSNLLIHLAPAGMLASDNELSRHFPGGYRAIAALLNPRRVWVCWQYARPGEKTGGLAYDGLVWCDDHWAWFPKPYRVLRELVSNREK